MKVLCYDIPDTLNYGSMMMAENFITYFHQFYANISKNDLEFIILTYNNKLNETLERFREAVDEKIKIKVLSFDNIIGNNKVQKLFNIITGYSICKFVKQENVDMIVVFGGDDFTSDDRYIIKELLQFYHYNRSGKKVYFFSQTMGPFNKRLASFYKLFLKKFVIFTRDPSSYNYLHDILKLNNVILSADLAFLPLYREKQISLESNISNYITLIPSGLIYKEAKENKRESYIKFLTLLVIRLLKENDNDYILKILPHVLSPEKDDDRLIARDLYINLLRNGINRDRIILFDKVLLPYQAREIIGKSKFVITGRMHAAISALEQNVPVLSLAYSGKYYGIIGDYFGLKELIVDVRNHTWDELFPICLEKSLFINEHYEEIKSIIIKKLPLMQSRDLNSIKATVKEVALENED